MATKNTTDAGTVAGAAPANTGEPVPASETAPLVGGDATNPATVPTDANKPKRGKKGGGDGNIVDRADAIQAAANAKKAAIANEKIVKAHVAAVNSGWKPDAPKVMPLPSATGKPVANALVFDRRLQMRATGSAMCNAELATEYGESMKENAKDQPDRIAHGFPQKVNGGFPALKAIRITDEDKIANKLDGNVIVWDGFHTALGARDTAGFKEFPCEIMDGTYRFARLLALGANSSHGERRSTKDAKHLLKQIIEDAELLSDAVAFSEANKGDDSKGGLSRALCYTIGASKGSVWLWLKELGKGIERNKIVDLKPQPPENPTQTPLPPDMQPGAANPAGELVSGVATDTNYDKFNAVIRLHTAVERTLGELMQDETARDVMVEVSKTYGHPINRNIRVEDGKEVVSYSWPSFDQFVEMFDQFAFVFKTKTQPAEPTDATK